MAVTSGALDGVVVLDLGRVLAAPYCAQTLADLGATVIKIENPHDPDVARGFPPYLRGVEEPTAELSAYYAQYNRGKLGITLDLSTPEGGQALKDLVRHAHVLIENFRPGTLERFGLGYDVLSLINPGLVYTAISGYGRTGSRRRRPAFDSTAQAAGGLWSMNGSPDSPAVRVGTAIGDAAATLHATTGTLAALRHAERTGVGQVVDISQVDCVIALTETAVVDYTVDGAVATRHGNVHPFVRPYETFECLDGEVFFAGYTDKFWRLTCEMFGDPAAADDPAIDTMRKRFDATTYAERVRPLLAGWFAGRTKAELEELAGDLIPLTAVKGIDEVVDDPGTAEREMVVDVPYDDFGTVRMFGQPIKLSQTPAQPARKANAPGADTDAVLSEFAGYDALQIARLRAAGAV